MKKILLLLFGIQPLMVFAQTESDIRQLYAEVNNKIKESIEQGFEGPLYNNQWINNKYNKSWPAVGIYTETTDFWYDDSPDHLSPGDRNPKNVLVKISISRISSVMHTNTEYLFKEGKLVFYYNKNGDQDNAWETRLYFTEKGNMFKSSIKLNNKELSSGDFLLDQNKDHRPDGGTVMADSKKYQDLFIKSM